jgi:CubicO group peptidase (beta-lactamase class C family)
VEGDRKKKKKGCAMSDRPAADDTTLAALAPELDALAAEAMAEWKVPAVTLAVVQNGETVLLKAWGQRDVEAGLPATPQTQFTICSITKTFTATALALLVDEGRLDWTKPVREYIPEFRMHDAIATEHVTVRDLLCHHSGLPRHDWIWIPADLTPTEMMMALRHLEPRGISAPSSNTTTSPTTPPASLPSASAAKATSNSSGRS